MLMRDSIELMPCIAESFGRFFGSLIGLILGLLPLAAVASILLYARISPDSGAVMAAMPYKLALWLLVPVILVAVGTFFGYMRKIADETTDLLFFTLGKGVWIALLLSVLHAGLFVATAGLMAAPFVWVAMKIIPEPPMSLVFWSLALVMAAVGSLLPLRLVLKYPALALNDTDVKIGTSWDVMKGNTIPFIMGAMMLLCFPLVVGGPLAGLAVTAAKSGQATQYYTSMIAALLCLLFFKAMVMGLMAIFYRELLGAGVTAGRDKVQVKHKQTGAQAKVKVGEGSSDYFAPAMKRDTDLHHKSTSNAKGGKKGYY